MGGSMSEADFVRKIVENLNQHIVTYAMRTHTSAHGKRGTPDIIGCYDGRMFVIEAKLEYNKPTAIQSAELQKWRDAGALACVLTHYPGMNIGREVDRLLQAVSDEEAEDYVQT